MHRPVEILNSVDIGDVVFRFQTAVVIEVAVVVGVGVVPVIVPAVIEDLAALVERREGGVDLTVFADVHQSKRIKRAFENAPERGVERDPAPLVGHRFGCVDDEIAFLCKVCRNFHEERARRSRMDPEIDDGVFIVQFLGELRRGKAVQAR